jgi:predicted nucleic acid-binding protein
MANKLFIDTNILIDYTLRREFELDAVDKIFELAEDNKVKLYLSESVITTTLYFLEKNKINGLRIMRKLSPIITIVPLKNEILFSPLEKFKETEDGLLFFMATTNHLDYFITRNEKHFTTPTPLLKVITPNNFIAQNFSINDL